MRTIIEICTGSMVCALAAISAGAHRLELCSALPLGGLTPSHGLMEAVIKASSTPVNILIRPRSGDFHYDQREFQVMKADVFSAKALGANGIVTGMLNRDGKVDTCRMQVLIDMARPMEVTFHRAFDSTPNLFEALDSVMRLGCDRILTSGGEITAMEGMDVLKGLVDAAARKLSIMPGSGINPENLLHLVEYTGAREFHASASVVKESSMKHQHKLLHFGDPGLSSNATKVTSASQVAALCEIAREFDLQKS
ncbi:MAG: copper homeostasis protein CutC [Lentimicrobiaceae bacterium]|jgi:copper homeostasis protein|nr:copper homeostasis protein CutC [Lentimicrobiaceae bacterium]MDY0024359.1 copper homeostasis protein CutC [Lentimicrobium sp.]HAH59776.1 copper homeostasis protein CutC [Bacteroidales bacterium]